VATIVEALAGFGANLTFRDIPAAAVEKAKICVLDLIGIATAGAARSNSQVALKTAAALGAPGRAPVWLNGQRLRAIDAVLPNSVASHCILQDDWLPVSHAHVGAAVVPTALAVCEEEGGSGADLLTAIVAAYDIADRCGELSVPMFNRGFRPSALCAYFGATAAAAKLLRLDVEQTADALGCAGSVCGGVLQPWREGSMEWSFQEGLASRAGITAAHLARNGLAGSRTVIEGDSGINRSFGGTNEREAGSLDKLGEHFRIVDSCFKRFPTGGANQGSASVSHVLAVRHRIDWRRIVKVEVEIPAAGTHERMNYAGIDYAGPYRSFDQCLISKQFAIAMNLKTGDVRYTDMERERENPDFLALTRKIALRESGALHGWDLAMRVHLDDGTVVEGSGADIDHGQLYLDWARAVDKFKAVTRGLRSEDSAAAIVEAVRTLDDAPAVEALTAHL
jgi:2-methylcitrate dehydratase PrpD